ncbi:hypothetical protein M413DRAFT_8803 [Hebeloma cylindrosporum]|uniref:Uncharacterized protein n=1 Tax=Hebeloma cylindrosporum TaxID=76867 RepID=A0A0C2Y7A2_HEBCY|nr:hypothetical protein M413DRAFT_8803 [Hebeloma cylindrosporum h7]
MESAGSYEQTAFKPHIPGNILGSRNLPHECFHCHKIKPPGAPPSRICKSQKRFNEDILQNVRASSEIAPSGLSVKEEMIYQQDDFVRLHMCSISVAMECCIHEGRFDANQKFMRIGLQYLANGDGNPAKMFTLNYGYSGDLSDTTRCSSVQYKTMAKKYERWTGKPGFKGVLQSTCLPRLTYPIPIYDPLCNGPIVTGWYDRLKSMMDNGIVHRLLDDVWKPGVMIIKGKKWIFQERSREVLFAEYGVRVLY